MTLLNFGVTGPRFTKYTNNIARSSQIIFLKSEWPNRSISPILTLKLVVIATSLERSEMEGQIRNLRSNAYHMAKIGWKSVSRSCDNLSQRIYFLMSGCTPMTLLNSGVTGLKASSPNLHIEMTGCTSLAILNSKVYQIYTECSQIIADKLLKIRMAILQSVSVVRGAMNKGE